MKPKPKVEHGVWGRSVELARMSGQAAVQDINAMRIYNALMAGQAVIGLGRPDGYRVFRSFDVPSAWMKEQLRRAGSCDTA